MQSGITACGELITEALVNANLSTYNLKNANFNTDGLRRRKPVKGH